jgi:hypothetical protein
MGLTTAPATESIMGSLPPSKAGVGSAVNDTTRQTGGALGVAIIGSVFLFRYHNAVGTLSGLPPSVASAVRNSIGTALDAARTLPHAQQARIATIADHAFVSSMRLAYPVAAVVVLAAALVTWKFLPARAPDEPGDEDNVDQAITESLLGAEA